MPPKLDPYLVDMSSWNCRFIETLGAPIVSGDKETLPVSPIASLTIIVNIRAITWKQVYVLLISICLFVLIRKMK